MSFEMFLLLQVWSLRHGGEKCYIKYDREKRNEKAHPTTIIKRRKPIKTAFRLKTFESSKENNIVS